VVEESRQNLVRYLLARRRPAAGDEVHHLRVAVELDKVLDVVLGEPSQQQTLGREEDLHRSIVMSPVGRRA